MPWMGIRVGQAHLLQLLLLLLLPLHIDQDQDSSDSQKTSSPSQGFDSGMTRPRYIARQRAFRMIYEKCLESTSPKTERLAKTNN